MTQFTWMICAREESVLSSCFLFPVPKAPLYAFQDHAGPLQCKSASSSGHDWTLIKQNSHAFNNTESKYNCTKLVICQMRSAWYIVESLAHYRYYNGPVIQSHYFQHLNPDEQSRYHYQDRKTHKHHSVDNNGMLPGRHTRAQDRFYDSHDDN